LHNYKGTATVDADQLDTRHKYNIKISTKALTQTDYVERPVL